MRFLAFALLAACAQDPIEQVANEYGTAEDFTTHADIRVAVTQAALSLGQKPNDTGIVQIVRAPLDLVREACNAAACQAWTIVLVPQSPIVVDGAVLSEEYVINHELSHWALRMYTSDHPKVFLELEHKAMEVLDL